ncbi:hypothetical protein HZ326_14537 [Fusarium oxysporum f. sp. albedinis]|nr:hypothetical protein HZ326_14537 [Fusarium oxysporum f. sp. albedinis]
MTESNEFVVPLAELLESKMSSQNFRLFLELFSKLSLNPQQSSRYIFRLRIPRAANLQVYCRQAQTPYHRQKEVYLMLCDQKSDYPIFR